MSEKKGNIRKVVTVAVFVLLLLAAVYFYFSAPSNTEYTASSENSTEISSTADSSDYSTSSEQSTQSSEIQTAQLTFRNNKLLNQHYEKHGIEMGFASADEYEKAAAAVPHHPDVLHKTEKEDGDDVYYIESTNEFVVVSTDGYIRTYFYPNAGFEYFERQ